MLTYWIARTIIPNISLSPKGIITNQRILKKNARVANILGQSNFTGPNLQIEIEKSAVNWCHLNKAND